MADTAVMQMTLQSIQCDDVQVQKVKRMKVEMMSATLKPIPIKVIRIMEEQKSKVLNWQKIQTKREEEWRMAFIRLSFIRTWR